MNTKKAINRILTCFVVLSMSFLLPSQAQAKAQEETYSLDNTVYNSSCLTAIKLNNEQKDTLHKIVSVSKFYVIHNNRLSIQLDDKELANTYNFTNKQILFLHKNVLNTTFKTTTNNTTAETSKKINSIASAKKSNKCSGFYLSYADLYVGIGSALNVAAGVGPEALAAAFTSLSTMIGGPIGTIVSGSIAVLGIGFFIDLAAKIVGAVAQQKGICFTLQWGFPPLISTIM